MHGVARGHKSFLLFRSCESEFPVLTICPDFDISYKKDVLEKYNLTPSDVRKFRFPKNISLKPIEFLHEATHDLDTLINSIEFEFHHLLEQDSENEIAYKGVRYYNEHGKLNKNSNILKEIPLKNFTNWSVVYYHNLGRCYSLEVPKWIKKQQVMAIDFWYQIVRSLKD